MRNQKVYVAASWRTPFQPEVVGVLREDGHDVYDFRSGNGFSWREIDSGWASWTPEQYLQGIKHPRAVEGFRRDLAALEWCNTVVLLQPCGRSAHLELGYALGRGKRGAVLLAPEQEPDLMYKLTPFLFTSLGQVRSWVSSNNV